MKKRPAPEDPSEKEPMRTQIFHSLDEIQEKPWNQLASPDFPFLEYHFLRALETTNCLGRRTGWMPVYITVWNDHSLEGATVAYLKDNSYGEYIFDFAWAQASNAYKIPYYPKIVLAVPFTPATGSKLLLRRGLTEHAQNAVTILLLESLKETCRATESSSIHALFISKSELDLFQAAGFFIRHSFQYHWRNRLYDHSLIPSCKNEIEFYYSTFTDFLSSLKGKRRREISRERAQVSASGVTVERLTGDQLEPRHAELFYRFYSDTVDKRGGNEYLTDAFFQQVFKTMKDKILFVLARDINGEPVAGALYYLGRETLYGRHWGCLAEYRALHFELCYYQGIEFAIERRMKLFEAGAQGEHKFNRGFLPSLTYSAHLIENPITRELISDFVTREQTEIERVLLEYSEHSPFQNISVGSPA